VWGVDRLWLVEGEEKKVRSRGAAAPSSFCQVGAAGSLVKMGF